MNDGPEVRKSGSPEVGNTPRLVMRGVRKAFGATIALGGVDLEVHPGEVHALIGENGAGKSTLMKVLSGAHRPDAGSITLNGSAYAPGDPVAARRRGVAMIYQELTIAPDLSVAENVVLGRWPNRGGWVRGSERDRLTRAALDELGAEDIAVDARAGNLTNGQLQLIEIARALVREPQVLILDEPTSSLTRSDVDRLFAVVKRLAARGISIIYISHFLEEVQALCDHYTVLRDGCTVAQGAVAGTSMDTLIAAMVGRAVTDIYPKVAHQRGDALVQIDALAGIPKPQRCDLTLHRGEIIGIFGLIGAGRTEMARCVVGLDRLRSGAVTMNGETTTGWSTARMLGRGLGLLSENRKEEGLLLDQSIADNCTITRLGPHSIATLVSRRSQQQATRTWMETLGIKATSPAQTVGELSGGNQQKVALARLLHHDCAVLILDEPTRGVDIGAKATIYQQIGELAAAGKGILVISSYLPELLGICDTIGAMCRGVLSPLRPADEWDAQSLLAAAIGQEAA